MLNSFKKNKKGTVLFTVIVVMMLMIMITLATFVIAVAMQRKAMQNFTSNQSYITARSAVDAYVRCLTYKKSGAASPAELVANADALSMRKALIAMPDAATADATTMPKTKQNIYMVLDTPLESPAYSMGDITEFQVKRLTKDLFQVTAVATDGVRNSAYASGYDDTRSSTRVTATLSIQSKSDAGLFDSAMISTGSTNSFDGDTIQVYGGYIDTDNTNSVVTITKDSNFIGTFFSARPVSLMNGGNKIFLGNKRIFDGTDYVTEREFFHCANKVKFNGVTVISEINETARDLVPYMLIEGDFLTGYSGVGATTLNTIGSPTSRVDIYIKGGDAKLSNITIYGDVYCTGNVELCKVLQVHGNVYAASMTKHGEADASANAVTYAGTIPASVSFPTGGSDYKPTRYPSVDNFLKCNYDRDGDGDIDSADYDSDLDYWTGAGVNLSSLASSTPTMFGSVGHDITSNIRISGATSDASDGNAGSNVMWNINGVITIKPTTKDIWIVTPPSITFYGPGKIDVDNSGNTRVDDGNGRYHWKYNVYMYTPAGGGITFNTGNTLGYGGNLPADKGWASYKAAANYLGTIPPTASPQPTINTPSNFYWLIDGNGSATFNGISVHGYIYAPGLDLTTNTGIDNLSNTYYNQYKLPTGSPGSHYANKDFKPITIGSFIANKLNMKSQTGTVYVQPANSIFTSATSVPLEDRDWTLKNYSNLKIS